MHRHVHAHVCVCVCVFWNLLSRKRLTVCRDTIELLHAQVSVCEYTCNKEVNTCKWGSLARIPCTPITQSILWLNRSQVPSPHYSPSCAQALTTWQRIGKTLEWVLTPQYTSDEAVHKFAIFHTSFKFEWFVLSTLIIGNGPCTCKSLLEQVILVLL